MLAPQEVQIFLNNALQPTRYQAELASDKPLPEIIREMPDEVSGHFLAMDSQTAHDIEQAWKRIMILNATKVLYDFKYDPATATFSAHKR